MLKLDCFHLPLRMHHLEQHDFLRGDSASGVSSSCSLVPGVSVAGSSSSIEVRHAQPDDLTPCYELLCKRANVFPLAHVFTLEQCRHRLLDGHVARTFIAPGRQHELSVDGLASFLLIPLRSSTGHRILQAQLHCFALSPHAPVDSTCRALLAAAIQAARSEGADVFNVHAAAEWTPSLLAALDFVQGDGVTYVQLEDGSENNCETMANEDDLETLDPTKTGWLPTV